MKTRKVHSKHKTMMVTLALILVIICFSVSNFAMVVACALLFFVLWT